MVAPLSDIFSQNALSYKCLAAHQIDPGSNKPEQRKRHSYHGNIGFCLFQFNFTILHGKA